MERVVTYTKLVTGHVLKRQHAVGHAVKIHDVSEPVCELAFPVSCSELCSLHSGIKPDGLVWIKVSFAHPAGR